MELVARGVSGIAASGLSTLAAFYLMQGLPQDKRIAGFLLAIGLTQVAVPLARAISPLLLADGDIANLFILQFALRSEEHTSELQSLMRISYAVFCLKQYKQHFSTIITGHNHFDNTT